METESGTPVWEEARRFSTICFLPLSLPLGTALDEVEIVLLFIMEVAVTNDGEKAFATADMAEVLGAKFTLASGRSGVGGMVLGDAASLSQLSTQDSVLARSGDHSKPPASSTGDGKRRGGSEELMSLMDRTTTVSAGRVIGILTAGSCTSTMSIWNRFLHIRTRSSTVVWVMAALSMNRLLQGSPKIHYSPPMVSVLG